MNKEVKQCKMCLFFFGAAVAGGSTELAFESESLGDLDIAGWSSSSPGSISWSGLWAWMALLVFLLCVKPSSLDTF
jgi:hypothetical protein